MEKKVQSVVWQIVEWLCRLVPAAYFIAAALPKLLDPMAFAKAINNYDVVFPLIGKNYIYLAAMLMPPLELAGAVAILFNRWKRSGVLFMGGLLLVFTILIGQAVARGLNIDCGCFGTGAVAHALAQKAGWSKLLENAGMLLMCAYVYWAGDAKDEGGRMKDERKRKAEMLKH